ncbi:MAG: CBS domain-containing protein, partial [Candidatus Puniceispirillaceae bacterium]
AGSLVASDHIAISVNDSLQTAIERAADFVGETIPVLSEDGTQMAGIVTEGDVFSAYLDTQHDIQRIEHG